MTDALTAMLAPQRWPTFVLITARLSGLMMTAPLWSMTALPRVVRGAITVVLAAVLLPLADPARVPEHVLELPFPVASELLVGIVIGLAAAVLVQGASLGGEVLSLQMGLSLGPALAPMPEVPISGIGQLQSMLALLVYVGMGGHLMLIRGLADSIRVLPPGTLVGFEGGRTAIELAGGLFASALRTAAPVMVSLLLGNLALAVLSRAVPQFNAMMVSLPLSMS